MEYEEPEEGECDEAISVMHLHCQYDPEEDEEDWGIQLDESWTSIMPLTRMQIDGDAQ